MRCTGNAISLNIISETLRMSASEFSLPESSLLDDQEKRFSGAFDVLQQAIAEHVFPGASAAVTENGSLVALKACGRFTYDADAPVVTPATVFDLASVTKVVASTAVAMLLYERGLIDLDAPLAGIVPEFISEDSRRRDVTLRMLLAHCSGLPAYEKLFLEANDRENLLQLALVPMAAATPSLVSRLNGRRPRKKALLSSNSSAVTRRVVNFLISASISSTARSTFLGLTPA